MSEQGNEQVNRPQEPEETVSLASILSEYKSEAYVRNERRLSKEELEQRAEAIIREMKQSVEDALDASPEPDGEREEAAAPAEETASAEAEPAPAADTQAAPAEPEEVLRIWAAEHTEQRRSSPVRIPAEPVPEPEEDKAEEADDPVEAGAPGGAASAEETAPAEETAAPDEAADVPLEEPETTQAPEAPEPEAPRISRREQRRQQAAQRAAAEAAKKAAQPELSPVEAARRYASGVGSLQRRTAPAFLLCAVMALLMALSSAGVTLPGFLRGEGRLALALAVCQLAVMLLGLDVMLRGLGRLLTGKPDLETLTAVANLSALADAALTVAGLTPSASLPYCGVSALALAFTMLGVRLRRSAYRDIFRTMRAAKIPTVVTAEEGLAEEGVVLVKKLGSAKGFVSKSLEPDLAQSFYRKQTPLLLALSLALSLIAAWASAEAAPLHCFAGVSTAAATLTAALAFNRPFALVTRKLAGSGAVLAGWRGAEEIRGAVGIVIRDQDVFPDNTVSLKAMKVLSGAPVSKVISYTGSMIQASDSGLKRVFDDLMRQYATPLYHTTDFDCGTEGGISAFIEQNQVMVGSAAYMNLMGIRVPSSVDVAGAVYTAIDRELSGIFIVSYTPVELVQNALLRLRKCSIHPIFAIRDFNVNAAVLKSKFKVDTEGLPFLPAETRYQLSMDVGEAQVPAALMSREGLGHYVETARSARRLVRTTRRALRMTVCGALLGMLLMFFSMVRGAMDAASAWNLMVYMLLWAFATGMIADSADGN